jgi:SAM-dependent methyltransferase/uncharacterized protein YbaR (Trm112 family)
MERQHGSHAAPKVRTVLNTRGSASGPSFSQSRIDPWLLERLACPRDHSLLTEERDNLVCERSHKYPVAGGIPVLLVLDETPTQWVIAESIRDAYFPEVAPAEPPVREGEVDPFVQSAVVMTSGNLYRPVAGKLPRYPIPVPPLPPGDGRTLLDVGCNWGRWTVAAARLGYRCIGIDPSLRAVKAAQRVAKAERVECHFIVGDARHLPFSSDSIGLVFSYGVLQHFSPVDAGAALVEVGRVLTHGGMSVIQMANALGVRSAYQQIARGFREAKDFEVRYWRPRNLLDTFEDLIGESTMTADCFLGLGIQSADRDLLPLSYRMLVGVSELLKRGTKRVPVLANLADSVYITSRK